MFYLSLSSFHEVTKLLSLLRSLRLSELLTEQSQAVTL